MTKAFKVSAIAFLFSLVAAQAMALPAAMELAGKTSQPIVSATNTPPFNGAIWA